MAISKEEYERVYKNANQKAYFTEYKTKPEEIKENNNTNSIYESSEQGHELQSLGQMQDSESFETGHMMENVSAVQGEEAGAEGGADAGGGVE